MNTTVVIVLPEWMVWLLLVLILLHGTQAVLGMYLAWLKHKVEKLKGESV